jgi:hypothetical protein
MDLFVLPCFDPVSRYSELVNFTVVNIGPLQRCISLLVRLELTYHHTYHHISLNLRDTAGSRLILKRSLNQRAYNAYADLCCHSHAAIAHIISNVLIRILYRLWGERLQDTRVAQPLRSTHCTALQRSSSVMAVMAYRNSEMTLE